MLCLTAWCIDKDCNLLKTELESREFISCHFTSAVSEAFEKQFEKDKFVQTHILLWEKMPEMCQKLWWIVVWLILATWQTHPASGYPQWRSEPVQHRRCEDNKLKDTLNTHPLPTRPCRCMKPTPRCCLWLEEYTLHNGDAFRNKSSTYVTDSNLLTTLSVH